MDITNVYDIMKNTGRYKGNRHQGLLGIEIETETLNSYTFPSLKYWTAKTDNSLRNFGVEYIINSPIDLPDLPFALKEIDNCNLKHKFQKESISTSIHTHLNFLNSTYLNVANFMTAWALVENVMIRYSGPDRLSNLFCLPICDAEGTIEKWTKFLINIERKDWKRLAHPNGSGELNNLTSALKYSALNIVPIHNLGTLEVRTFRGETDTKIVDKWIRILHKLYQFSHKSGVDPIFIMNLYKTHRGNIIKYIFEEYASEFNYPDLESLIAKNTYYAAEIASVSKDWSKFGIQKIKPVYKEKIKEVLDSMSQLRYKVGFDVLDYTQRLLVIEDYHRRYPETSIVDANEDM